MKPGLLQLLLLSAGLMLGGAVLADAPPAAGTCDISTHIADDGSVKLSNAEDAKCEAPAGTTAAVPAVTPEGTANGASDSKLRSTRASGRAPEANVDPSPADGSNGQSDPPKDPREQYRDAMMQGNPGTTAANPAVSRRYKAMDKASYQAKVLGGVAPESQTDAQSSAAPSQ